MASKKAQVARPRRTWRIGHGDLEIESTAAAIARGRTHERVFALCGPIGSPLHQTAKALETLMTEEFAYECAVITLSEFIKERIPRGHPLPAPGFAHETTTPTPSEHSWPQTRNSCAHSVSCPCGVKCARVTGVSILSPMAWRDCPLRIEHGLVQLRWGHQRFHQGPDLGRGPGHL